MDKTFLSILLISICWTGGLCQMFSDTTPLDSTSIVSASYRIYQSSLDPMCVSRTIGQQGRIYPSGQSMENLISLIERLETMLSNDTDTNWRQHLGADNVAKLLLRRFRFDGYDPGQASKQSSRDTVLTQIADAFFSQSDSGTAMADYKFPDRFFTQSELCSLYYMLSHNVYNITQSDRVLYSQQVFRGKRQTYNNRQQQQQNYGNYGKQNTNQNQNQHQNQFNRQYAPTDNTRNNQGAVQSNFLERYPIREEGVVSFRGNKDEAIAPARVLIGVIAGLSQSMKGSINDVLKDLNPRLVLGQDKTIDPLMAVTIGDLWGFATVSSAQNDEKKYYYGVSGQWNSGSCTTHYALTGVSLTDYDKAIKNLKATKAEIRGGIDGYLIGKNLKGVQSSTNIDTKSVRLSTILRSYYSKPKTYKSSAFTVSYCNRDQQQQLAINDLSTTANAYATLWAKFVSKTDIVDQLLGEFNTAFNTAQMKETSNGYNDYCSLAPSGVLDKNAPCETPSDIIYIIDGTTAQKQIDSSNIVALINGNSINFRSEGGTVSIFANSPGQNGVNPDINNAMPKGPEQWPLVAMAFNSTDTGYAQCRITDFNTTTLSPVPNTGKYYKFLNQTLFFYESWTPRANASGVPAKTAVLIDYDSVPVAPDSGTDRNDYNTFKDQLRYRHRDVKYISIANNQELFKDILRDDKDKESPTNVQQSASTLARTICENPATFQHTRCNDWKSDNLQYVGYVTPGYKQNWAMYPEFFLKSFDITFRFTPEDGDIKVCFDRWPNPENLNYCKDLKRGENGEFKISNPCKGKSLSSCEPFYFTVWGKDRTTNTQCSDPKCLSMDQIKFTVTNWGVQCSSSNHLLPSTTFQLISLSIFAILYLFFK